MMFHTGNTPPPSPQVGELWLGSRGMRVYDGTEWVSHGGNATSGELTADALDKALGYGFTVVVALDAMSSTYEFRVHHRTLVTGKTRTASFRAAVEQVDGLTARLRDEWAARTAVEIRERFKVPKSNGPDEWGPRPHQGWIEANSVPNAFRGVEPHMVVLDEVATFQVADEEAEKRAEEAALASIKESARRLAASE